MSNTDDIRGWAIALPEVSEKQHHLFKVPEWQVRGRTFVGMARDPRSVVCCVSESVASAMAAAFPDACALVWRQDARKSFLGVQVTLDNIADDRLKALVEQAWRQHAPKRLAVDFDRRTTASR